MAYTLGNEHLYSPRMVGEIKEKKPLEHQTNKQWYGLTILTTVYNSLTITTKEKCLAYTLILKYLSILLNMPKIFVNGQFRFNSYHRKCGHMFFGTQCIYDIIGFDAFNIESVVFGLEVHLLMARFEGQLCCACQHRSVCRPSLVNGHISKIMQDRLIVITKHFTYMDDAKKVDTLKISDRLFPTPHHSKLTLLRLTLLRQLIGSFLIKIKSSQ